MRGGSALIVWFTAHTQVGLDIDARGLSGQGMGLGIVGKENRLTGRRGRGSLRAGGAETRPGEDDVIGIEIEGLHLPRLVVIDDRERHAQRDAAQGFLLGVEYLDLVRSQQIDQARRVALHLADAQGQRTGGCRVLRGARLAQIEGAGSYLDLKAAIAADESQRLDPAGSHHGGVGLRASERLGDGFHRGWLSAGQRRRLYTGLLRLFLWRAHKGAVGRPALWPFGLVLLEGQMSHVGHGCHGSGVDQ